MKPINLDLTLEVCSEDGSRTQFYQDNEDQAEKLLRLLLTPRLFGQTWLIIASERSSSAIPCRGIDLLLARTQKPLQLTLPPGWLNVIEVSADTFLNREMDGDSPADTELPAEGSGDTFIEIHTSGDWLIQLKLSASRPVTVQEQRQFLVHFFELPVIPYRLLDGGAGFINPQKISRITLSGACHELADSALPADLLRCVRP